MNHVLQCSQLKFKLDLLMKLEILGSIPSGVANLWTLIRSTGPARLAFKRKEKNKKFVFSSFEKPAPDEERCCLESPLTFYFCF